MFDDIVKDTKKQESSVKEDYRNVDEEEEQKEEKLIEPKRGRTMSGKKLPAGAVSLFGAGLFLETELCYFSGSRTWLCTLK